MKLRTQIIQPFTFTLVLCLSLMVLASCASTPQDDTLSTAPDADSIFFEADAEDAIYSLHSGDTIRVSVFGEADLSNDYLIDSNGRITMPLIGEVDAANNGTLELADSITDILISNGYFNDPKVTVGIISKQPFYILGEVRTPGSYDYTQDLDLFKAIATAGGYTPRASKGSAIIVRKVNGENTTLRASENTIILPGDSIKIKQRIF